MTGYQNFMLAACFGGMMGYIIGNAVFLIKCAWDGHNEKKRKQAEEAEKATE